MTKGDALWIIVPMFLCWGIGFFAGWVTHAAALEHDFTCIEKAHRWVTASSLPRSS